LEGLVDAAEHKAKAEGPRTWEMWAGRNSSFPDEWMYASPDRWYVEAYKLEPVRVVVTTDDGGSCYGWMGAASEVRGVEADEHPVMIQPRRSMFNMQFEYDPQSEVDRGRGEIVRLRIEERPAK
jgi:hypothetical protein